MQHVYVVLNSGGVLTDGEPVLLQNLDCTCSVFKMLEILNIIGRSWEVMHSWLMFLHVMELLVKCNRQLLISFDI